MLRFAQHGLSESLRGLMQAQVAEVRRLHGRDVARGLGEV
jgi:hypothetical protein